MVSFGTMKIEPKIGYENEENIENRRCRVLRFRRSCVHFNRKKIIVNAKSWLSQMDKALEPMVDLDLEKYEVVEPIDRDNSSESSSSFHSSRLPTPHHFKKLSNC